MSGSARARNLAMRLATAATLIPVILWLLFWAPLEAFFIVGLMATAGVGAELAAMVPGADVRGRLWIVVASTALAALLTWQTGWSQAVPLPSASSFVMLLVVVVGGMSFALRPMEDTRLAGARAGWLIGGPVYVGATMAALLSLHTLPQGGRWVVLAMTLAWVGDTSAYAVGLTMGRRKLAPRLSPKKTVEGALGGLLGSVAAAVFASLVYLPDLPTSHAVFLGLFGGALGQSGDLFESLLKRAAGVKDSGTLLPGHGGLLDRIDALMVTAAVTWAYAASFAPP